MKNKKMIIITGVILFMAAFVLWFYTIGSEYGKGVKLMVSSSSRYPEIAVTNCLDICNGFRSSDIWPGRNDLNICIGEYTNSCVSDGIKSIPRTKTLQRKERNQKNKPENKQELRNKERIFPFISFVALQ